MNSFFSVTRHALALKCGIAFTLFVADECFHKQIVVGRHGISTDLEWPFVVCCGREAGGDYAIQRDLLGDKDCI